MSAQLDTMILQSAIAEGFSPKAALLIVAQARYETGDYTSFVFRNNNNLFGMKFVGQPLATQGTPAPKSEGDYYAKYKTPVESVKDLVGRLYKRERKGIGYEQLRNVSDSTEFANKLKQRDYFGVSAEQYARGLNAKLLKIKILDIANQSMQAVQRNKGKVIIGLILIGLSVYLYFKSKK